MEASLSTSQTTITPSCSSSLSGHPPFLPYHLPHSSTFLKLRKPCRNTIIWACHATQLETVQPVEGQEQEEPADSPLRLLRELEEKKKLRPKSKKKDDPKYRLPSKSALLRTPMDDEKLARKFLESPQLSLKTFPLLSSCLPNAPLKDADKAWMEDNLLEAKPALGYPLEAPPGLDANSPASYFDTMLYLAFQHEATERGRRIRYIRLGHSRLVFLGDFVTSLGLCEFLLQRYPREGPAMLREREFGMTNKRILPYWVTRASLDNLVFPNDDITKLKRFEREPIVKSVFNALMGAIYVCFGMAEIYRVLFEVFGMDPDSEECQPKQRREADIDYVSSEFDGKQLTWQDVVAYKRPPDALFAYPRLFRACVPPGMHRFHGNIWEIDTLPHIFSSLGYPLPMSDAMPEVTSARNMELALGLQLCFLHPSKYKSEHPRFCFERFEYLGQKIQTM
eukprot:TRINITY_DN1583_c0_g1_i7.p1 TRINITY_DN1583_c0_g1~~TRINITY_DN1583_c0_g1_i7.p1  ORF type:complete len:451 (-),score=61.85 TRINITY_DN1583_c0_g1_i7:584-1936(-)